MSSTQQGPERFVRACHGSRGSSAFVGRLARISLRDSDGFEPFRVYRTSTRVPPRAARSTLVALVRPFFSAGASRVPVGLGLVDGPRPRAERKRGWAVCADQTRGKRSPSVFRDEGSCIPRRCIRCYYVYTHLLTSLSVTSFPPRGAARRPWKKPIDFAISLKLNVAFALIAARATRRAANYAFAYAHTC